MDPPNSDNTQPIETTTETIPEAGVKEEATTEDSSPATLRLELVISALANTMKLSEQETTKLKYVSSLIDEAAIPSLSHSFELNHDDAAKFALALKLLASVNVPEKIFETANPRPHQPVHPSYPPVPAPYGHPYPPSPYPPPMYPPYPGYGAPAPGQPLMYSYSVPAVTHAHQPRDYRQPIGDARSSDCTIYIRGLPPQCTEPEIVAVFCNFGTIRDIRMQMDKETNTFIGSVFIEYLTSAAAKLAKVQMDKKLWAEKTLYIDFAKERMNPSKPPPPTGPPSPSLYLSGLPLDLDREALRSLFSRFGNIDDCRILMDTANGASRGIAFLDFEVQESAAAAIDHMNESTLGGKLMKVQYAMSSKRKGAPLDAPGAKRPRSEAPPPHYGPPPGYPYDPMYYGAPPPPHYY